MDELEICFIFTNSPGSLGIHFSGWRMTCSILSRVSFLEENSKKMKKLKQWKNVGGGDKKQL